MRDTARLSIVGGVFVLMVGGAGFGVWSVLGGDLGDGGPAVVRSGPPSGAEIRETAEGFLAAWAKGDAYEAASLTDNPTDVHSAITEYSREAHVSDVKITPGDAVGARVPFKVAATVSYRGKSRPLAYESELTVVRGQTTGLPLVDWKASVLHPELERGDVLKAGTADGPRLRAVDRNGVELTEEKYPSLGPVLDELRKKYIGRLGGEPGIELWIERAGDGAADETLLTLAEGKPAVVRTRLSATAQAAAERAVAKGPNSSVVAVQPSTGDVLAVANHDAFNTAFLGRQAPGSTMKIISAAMLIDKGLATADGEATCPDTAVSESKTFRNLPGLAPNENGTLIDGFARSCNTAFVKFADEVAVGDLTNEARQYFGIGADWKTGIVSSDGRVPASGGPFTAANMIGQGDVTMNPLNMASVAATVKAGVFRQPVIVPQSLDDRQLATAQPLSASTASQLRQMMQRTALNGTGAKAMSGLGTDIGAKTGSAEVDGQTMPNSWFTGYRGDMAVAAVAQEGGHGGDTAGPIVAQVLRAGS
ncbi:penicillin-binding transpeptidase domain-containing protein [Streptomyces sp. NPDC020681]|uniref:penicillin-binding transpeptidase domain-containing protein n=1 Tax=Streptomyces sp. NPDC020681 TaxID=3365083 RepID=UPI003797CE3F